MLHRIEQIHHRPRLRRRRIARHRRHLHPLLPRSRARQSPLRGMRHPNPIHLLHRTHALLRRERKPGHHWCRLALGNRQRHLPPCHPPSPNHAPQQTQYHHPRPESQHAEISSVRPPDYSQRPHPPHHCRRRSPRSIRPLHPAQRLRRQSVERRDRQFQVLELRVLDPIVADSAQRLHKQHHRRNAQSRDLSRVVQRP